MNQLSENTNRKFIETFEISDWNIETDKGWFPITHIHKTIPYEEYTLITESGYVLVCADTHIIFDEHFNEIYVKDCIPFVTRIITKSGIETVIEVSNSGIESNMYDLTIDSEDHRFYTGEILSHNSTVLDAISFSLFGKPFRKINKPQLINSINQKNLVTEIEFSIGSNEYKIIRGLKPNIFEIYKNNTLLNQSAETKDYQEILEKQIIKCNFKSFTQVVMLGSATFQSFMQLSLSQRREIIEDLLDLEIFSTMNTVLKDKLTNNNDLLNDLSTNKRVVSEKIKINKEYLRKIQIDNIQVVEEKNKNIQENLNRIEEYKSIQITLKTKLEKFKSSINDISKISDRFNKLNTLKYKLEANLNVLQKDLKFLRKYDDCPTCKQSIDNTFKCDNIDNKQLEISKIEDNLSKINIEIDKINVKQNKIKEIQSTINSIEIDLHTYNTKINSINSYIDILRKEIENIGMNNSNIDESNIINLENELGVIENEYNECMENKKLLNAVGVLLKDNGIKSKIIKQYIPVLNKLINKYLSSMEFMCHFELDENFNETIKSRFRDEFSYSSFSEGEKLRIDLAILFAWRAVAKSRNSVNTNLLIMDEVMDSSADSTFFEYFFKILNELQDSNIIIISHNEQIAERFNNVIRFEKKKNFSRIVS